MAHVVTEPCIGCRNTACVEVCPAECFHIDEQSLWIDPEECIDCKACVPECPVDAIFLDVDVPEKWTHFIKLNEEKAEALPLIFERKEPLS